MRIVRGGLHIQKFTPMSKPTVPLTPLCPKIGVLCFRRNGMAYVYGHYKADTNELFYIGKGIGRRAWSKSGRNRHWKFVANKHGFIVKILHDNLTDEEAFTKEKELITEVGLEQLANIAEGGIGLTSEIVKLAYKDPEYNRKHQEHLERIRLDPEIRKRHKEAVQKTMQTPEYKKTHRTAMQKVYDNPEFREKISKIHKELYKNDEYLEKRKEQLSKLHNNPEWKRKNKEHLANIREVNRLRKDEIGKKISEGLKKYHANKKSLDKPEQF